MLKPDTSGYPASTRHSTTYYWIQCILYITKSISGSNTSRHFSFLCGPKNHTAGFKLKISISPSEIIINLINWETRYTVLQKKEQICVLNINFTVFTTVKIDCGTSTFWVKLYKQGYMVGSYSAPHVEYWRTLTKKSRHREVNMMEARDCSILVTQIHTMVPL
jgi:hypothetical protein